MALTSPIIPPTGAAVIHASAIIEQGAKIGAGVSIGPFCHVAAGATLEDGVSLVSHVSIAGTTIVGARVKIYPFASIGHPPQDLKYRGESVRLIIGPDCLIREGVTMNPGTAGGGMVTRVGDNSLFMVGVHIAHDCQIGNRVVMANNATLAGHVIVEDNAIIGGLCGVHQYVRIGRHAMLGAMSAVVRDIIPYGQVAGDRATLHGVNIIGMQRGGFSREEIQALRHAYQLLFSGDGTLSDRVAEVAERFAGIGPVADVVAFIRADSSRAFCQPKGDNDG